jgi:formate hydrogenlyase transcriptional activator
MAAVAERTAEDEHASAPGQFSQLLLELSVRFVHLPPDQVDGEIEDALRRVCELLGIQRSSLWQGSHEAPDKWRLTHVYQHPDHAGVLVQADGEIVPRGGWTLFQPAVPPRRMVMAAQEYFPWVSRKLRRNEIVVLNSLDDLPPAAAHDRKSFTQLGGRSILVFPLVAGDRVFGVLSFAMLGEERTWVKDIVDNLHLISQTFAYALTRKIDDLALRQSEERLNAAATAAGLALWSIEQGSERLWVNETGRDRFELPSGGLTLTGFFALVHPEDRARVEEAYRSSAGGAETHVEYRLVRSDGSVRWACSRGQLQFDSAGKPQRVMGVTLDITERKAMEGKIEGQLCEISRLKKQLEVEVVVLRDQVAASRISGEILGTSDAIQYVHFRIGQVAPLDTTVLIQGETGTGKNLAAAAIHAQSGRKDHPLVIVSCAALPGNLIESELFGRDRGAFTGADQTRVGRFELADGATIFLDEIGDLPLELQAKLLRVVQTGEFERLGSAKTIKVNVRIIAATNWDLGEAVREGRFRADLFYRLNVFPITMPPLRARKEDIPRLTQVLVEKFARRSNKSINAVSSVTLKTLQDYDWPGNVRELENVIERAVIVCTGPILHLADPLCDCPLANRRVTPAESPGTTLEEIDGEHIRRILLAVGWRIEGKGGAADLLGLNSSTLRARMRKLGIQRRKDTRS